MPAIKILGVGAGPCPRYEKGKEVVGLRPRCAPGAMPAIKLTPDH